MIIRGNTLADKRARAEAKVAEIIPESRSAIVEEAAHTATPTDAAVIEQAPLAVSLPNMLPPAAVLRPVIPAATTLQTGESLWMHQLLVTREGETLVLKKAASKPSDARIVRGGFLALRLEGSDVVIMLGASAIQDGDGTSQESGPPEAPSIEQEAGVQTETEMDHAGPEALAGEREG
jgi:hypothetical protein